MYHHREIVEAIADLCGGMVRLSQDLEGSDVVRVGSNRLFRVGDLVKVTDDAGGSEERVVAELQDLSMVKLDAAVSGRYQVARGARLKLLGGRVPSVVWIGRGRPELAPQPLAGGFPCIVVDPVRLEQPVRGGSNRTFIQDYWTSVYYMRRAGALEEEQEELLGEVSGVFNLLMSDPYLGGTCWYSQVTQVEYSPEAERLLRDSGVPVRVVRMDVVARRSELVSAG